MNSAVWSLGFFQTRFDNSDFYFGCRVSNEFLQNECSACHASSFFHTPCWSKYVLTVRRQRLVNGILSREESCDITCNTTCSFWYVFIRHIDVESLGFRFDQQEICDQFICEVAGFNEDTLAFILFMLNFSKFGAKISLRLVTQHCCGLKNDILLSRLK